MSDYVYGRNSFFEALANKRITMAYVSNDKEIKDRGILYKVVSRKELDRMAKGGNHQGYLAEVKPFRFAKVEEMLKDKHGLIVVLDGLSDVHNLGAIIRTCECAGVDGLIYKSHNSVRVNDTVAKVASGALEYVKIAEVKNTEVKDTEK